MVSGTQERTIEPVYDYKIEETVELADLPATVDKDTAQVNETETCAVTPGWVLAIKDRIFSRRRKTVRYTLGKFAARFVTLVLLSASITLYILYPTQTKQTARQAPQNLVVSVSENSNNSNLPAFTAEDKQLPTEVVAKVSAPAVSVNDAVAERSLSEILSHVANRSVQIAKRSYQFLSNSHRSYLPGFIAPKTSADRVRQVQKEEPLQLKVVAGNSQRYRLQNSKVEWQGGWFSDDPAKNIELGTAYRGYLNSNFERSTVNNLTVFNKGKNQALKSIPKQSAAPNVGR